MLRSTSLACWELHELDQHGDACDLIDSAQTLGEIVLHYERGRFDLPAEGAHGE